MPDPEIDDDVLAAMLRDAADNFGKRAAPDQTEISRQRAEGVLQRMGVDKSNTPIFSEPPPRYVAGAADNFGTSSAEESRQFTMDREQQESAIAALAAKEDERLQDYDHRHAGDNEGTVQPDGSVVFSDWRARAGTPEGVKERDDVADRARAFYSNPDNFKLYDGVMTPGKKQRGRP